MYDLFYSTYLRAHLKIKGTHYGHSKGIEAHSSHSEQKATLVGVNDDFLLGEYR